MIDRAKRNELAELLRHFAAGRMNNRQFEKLACDIVNNTQDEALSEIFWKGAWCLYDDLFKHKLRREYKLPSEGRHEVARWIIFLYSDLKYEWPVVEVRAGKSLPFLKRLIKFICYLPVLFLMTAAVIILCSILFVGLMLIVFNVADYLESPIVGGLGFFVIIIILAVLICWFNDIMARREGVRYREKMSKLGDYDVWPFIRREDFEQARRQPRLLTGNERT